MANLHFYVASCALMLVLNLRASSGVPVRPLSSEQCDRCAELFRGLLTNVAELLESEPVCFGIKSENVAVRSRADTVEACAPNVTENSGCMMQRSSSFSESECLMNIMKDLAHYDATIRSYLSSNLRSRDEEVALLSPTLEIIQNLRKKCSLVPNVGNDSSEEEAAAAAQLWGSDSFINRLEMCKMMRGFHVRAITINRAMGYISSGDHRM